MRFSQRIGKAPISKKLQIEQIDEELKNRLWNVFQMHILSVIRRNTSYMGNLSLKDEQFVQGIYHSYFKEPIDVVPTLFEDLQTILKRKLFVMPWFEIYDFYEFIINDISYREDINKEVFVLHFNEILEQEFSGYRVLNDRIVPISNSQELGEVEKALNFSSIEGVNIHLTNSLDKLSDKKNPDYKNSIKESISAVESACRVLTGESTFGKAFKKLESKGVHVNQQLKSGFEKIYAYTNDKESGIRHSIVDEFKNPDFEDAKYMLISCSAFVNYLVGKNVKLNK